MLKLVIDSVSALLIGCHCIVCRVFVVQKSDSYEYKEFVRLQEYNLDPNIIKDKVERSTDQYTNQFLPHNAMQSAVLLWQIVCPFVMLRYRDHLGRNSLKIISHLVILGRLLSADRTSRNTPKFWPEQVWPMKKSGFQRTKSLTSLKCGMIAPRLLLRTYRKSHICF